MLGSYTDPEGADGYRSALQGRAREDSEEYLDPVAERCGAIGEMAKPRP